jgi:hypothetical protein
MIPLLCCVLGTFSQQPTSWGLAGDKNELIASAAIAAAFRLPPAQLAASCRSTTDS